MQYIYNNTSLERRYLILFAWFFVCELFSIQFGCESLNSQYSSVAYVVLDDPIF